MSAEKLYQNVKSGKVKMEDLNEAGKNALRQHMGMSAPTQSYERNEMLDKVEGLQKLLITAELFADS